MVCEHLCHARAAVRADPILSSYARKLGLLADLLEAARRVLGVDLTGSGADQRAEQLASSALSFVSSCCATDIVTAHIVALPALSLLLSHLLHKQD